MKMEFVKIGDEFSTEDGYLVITSRHGEDFWVDDYELYEDDEYVKVGERLLARHDLNRIAKEADGKNHNIWWEEL